MPAAQLEEELKTLIIEALALEDTQPEDIDPEAPLFVEGLGLDSIDALELGVAIQKKYGVTFSDDSDENKKYFASLRALAAFIESREKK